MSNSFTIRKKEYTFRELTIQDFYDIQLLAVTDNMDSGFEVISKISGCPVKILKGIYYEDWLDVWVKAQTFIKASMQDVKGKSKPVIRINGKEYGLINLDKMSIGEFSDLDIITSSANMEGRLHEAMAVLYRPLEKFMGIPYKVGEYDPDDFAQRAEEFKQFPLSQARINLGFFLTLGSTSLKATVDSLAKDLRKMEMDPEKTEELIKILKELPGIGTQLLTLSQEKIPSKSKKHPTLTLGQLLTGWLGRQTKLENKNSNNKKTNQDLENDK